MKKRNRLLLLVLLVTVLTATTVVWWGCTFREVGPVDMVEYDFGDLFDDIKFPELDLVRTVFPEVVPGYIDTSGCVRFRNMLQEAAETDILPDTLILIVNRTDSILTQADIDSLNYYETDQIIAYLEANKELPPGLEIISKKFMNDPMLVTIMPIRILPYIKVEGDDSSVSLSDLRKLKYSIFEGTITPCKERYSLITDFAECIEMANRTYLEVLDEISKEYETRARQIEQQFKRDIDIAESNWMHANELAEKKYNDDLAYANVIYNAQLDVIEDIEKKYPEKAQKLRIDAKTSYQKNLKAAAINRDHLLKLADEAFDKALENAEETSSTNMENLDALLEYLLDWAYDAYLRAVDACHDQGGTE